MWHKYSKITLSVRPSARSFVRARTSALTQLIKSLSAIVTTCVQSYHTLQCPRLCLCLYWCMCVCSTAYRKNDMKRKPFSHSHIFAYWLFRYKCNEKYICYIEMKWNKKSAEDTIHCSYVVQCFNNKRSMCRQRYLKKCFRRKHNAHSNKSGCGPMLRVWQNERKCSHACLCAQVHIKRPKSL